MPNTIERTRTYLKQHPIAALAILIVAAWLAPLVAVVLVAVTVALLVVPALLARHQPELAVELVEKQERQESLRLIQTTSAMGADRAEMVRDAERERFHAAQWDERAQRAVLAGDDAEASACLERRATHLAALAVVQAELERQTQAVAEMNAEVASRWPASPTSTGDNLRFLPARARRAEAKKQAALDRAGITPRSDLARRVQRAEDEAEALAATVGATADPLAEKFEREERSEQAARDLEELKRRVGMRRPALEGKKVG